MKKALLLTPAEGSAPKRLFVRRGADLVKGDFKCPDCGKKNQNEDELENHMDGHRVPFPKGEYDWRYHNGNDLVTSDDDVLKQDGAAEMGPAPVLGGPVNHPEAPNTNAMREQIDTTKEMEIGKSIEQKEQEVESGDSVSLTKGEKTIIINIAGKKKSYRIKAANPELASLIARIIAYLEGPGELNFGEAIHAGASQEGHGHDSGVDYMGDIVRDRFRITDKQTYIPVMEALKEHFADMLNVSYEDVADEWSPEMLQRVCAYKGCGHWINMHGEDGDGGKCAQCACPHFVAPGSL